METAQASEQQLANALYSQIAHSLINENKSEGEVIDSLMSQGISYDTAYGMVSSVQSEVAKAKKSRAQKDMLYGALWCIGGTVLTLAQIGFIFWGAILFGAIQFFKGLVNSFEA